MVVYKFTFVDDAGRRRRRSRGRLPDSASAFLSFLLQYGAALSDRYIIFVYTCLHVNLQQLQWPACLLLLWLPARAQVPVNF